MIKKTSDVIVPYLVTLYNACLKQGEFPDIYKIAKVIPLFYIEYSSGNTILRHIRTKFRDQALTKILIYVSTPDYPTFRIIRTKFLVSLGGIWLSVPVPYINSS